MRLSELVEIVQLQRGKPGGWPASYEYGVAGDGATISLVGKADGKTLRGLDCWGLAFISFVEQESGRAIQHLRIEIPRKTPGTRLPNIEALKRRLSFLSGYSGVEIRLEIDGEQSPLYSKDTLLNRPETEVVHVDVALRQDNTPGSIEKDFQTFLFNNAVRKRRGLEYNSNERLGVLGEDFYALGRKTYGMIREFPTGAFRNKVSANTRITPTEFVDIVSLNKWGGLSVIELKINDSQLEAVSQLLDYGLFFRCYADQIGPILRRMAIVPNEKQTLACYLASNRSHPRLNGIAPSYARDASEWGIQLKLTSLGHTAPFGE